MDRKKFKVSFEGHDEFLIASLCDDIELCEEIEYPVYTKYFYPPQIIKKILDMTIGNLKFEKYGLNDDCEKNMIAIYPSEFEEILDFPVVFFKIQNKSKFKTLAHKDYLGSILGLGLKRELLGDLIVEGDFCYGIATEESFKIIEEKLDVVGRNPVEISKITREEVPQMKYEEISTTVTSLRLDNIVPSIVNLSRNKSLELIESGLVSVNYSVEKDKSRILKEKDVVTIYKKGKYIFIKQIGESKKGKLRIYINKFD